MCGQTVPAYLKSTSNHSLLLYRMTILQKADESCWEAGFLQVRLRLVSFCGILQVDLKGRGSSFCCTMPKHVGINSDSPSFVRDRDVTRNVERYELRSGNVGLSGSAASHGSLLSIPNPDLGCASASRP